jgi:hypothetical protein
LRPSPVPIETLDLFTTLRDADWPIEGTLSMIEAKAAEIEKPRAERSDAGDGSDS